MVVTIFLALVPTVVYALERGGYHPMATNAVDKPVETEKKKRQRSPNYPTVGLREAIDRTKRFVTANGKAGAMPAIATKLIGFASAHGQAYSALSALKKFGLLEEKDGRVTPTQRAMEIASLPDADPRRLKAIRDAALSPTIYSELFEHYKDTNIPNDDTLAGELVAYKGFNPNGVKEFLKAFRETIEFAGLSDLTVLGSETKAEEEKPKPKVGDFVQWEHNGILGLPEARKLIKVSDDGTHGFVDGYATGLPVDEIIPADPPDQSSFSVPLRTLVRMPDLGKNVQGVKMRQDVFSLPEGEAFIHWPTPLSQDSIQELKDWLKLVERKITRSTAESSEKSETLKT
jgi:hypothetical protein